MQTNGHFIFRYVTGPIFIRKLYASAHLILFLIQFFFIITNLIQNLNETSELTGEWIFISLLMLCWDLLGLTMKINFFMGEET